MATRRINIRKPQELGGADWSFDVREQSTVQDLKDMLSTSSALLENGFNIPVSIMTLRFGAEALDDDTMQLPEDKVRSSTRVALEIQPKDVSVLAFSGFSEDFTVVRGCSSLDTVASLKKEMADQADGCTMNPAQVKLVKAETEVLMKDDKRLWEYGIFLDRASGGMLALSVRVVRTLPLSNVSVCFHDATTGRILTHLKFCRTDDSIASLREKVRSNYADFAFAGRENPIREHMTRRLSTATLQMLEQSTADTWECVMVDDKRRGERINDEDIAIGHYRTFFPDITEPVRILVCDL